MSEIIENQLFERDGDTNALVPIVSANLQGGDVLEVRDGRLHKRDVQTNALVPVVHLEGAAGGGGTAENTLVKDFAGGIYAAARAGVNIVLGEQNLFYRVELSVDADVNMIPTYVGEFTFFKQAGVEINNTLARTFIRRNDNFLTAICYVDAQEKCCLWIPFALPENRQMRAYGRVRAYNLIGEPVAVASPAITFPPVAPAFNLSNPQTTKALDISSEQVYMRRTNGLRFAVCGGHVLQSFAEHDHSPSSNVFFPSNGAMAAGAQKIGDWVTLTEFGYLCIERISPGPVMGFCKTIEIERNGGVFPAALNQNMDSPSGWNDLGGWSHMVFPQDRVRLRLNNYDGAPHNYVKAEAWTNVSLRRCEYKDMYIGGLSPLL